MTIPTTTNRRTRQAVQPAVLMNTVLQAGQRALEQSGFGWFPRSDVSVAPGGARPFDLRMIGFKRIELLVEPTSLAQRAGAVLPGGESAALKNIDQMAWAMVRLLAGYYDICPWDSWRHSRLIDAALRGAYPDAWPTRREEMIASTIATFFERCIVSHSLTEDEGDTFLMGLAYESAVNQHPSHLLIALWSRLMMLLFPRAAQPALSVSPIQPDPVADALLPKVMTCIFGSRIRFRNGRVRLIGRPSRPRSYDWSEKVEDLARLMARYLEQMPDRPDNQPNPFVRPPGGGGGGPGGGGEGDAVPGFLPPGDVNPFGPGRDGDGRGDRPILLPGGGLRPGHRDGPNHYENFPEVEAFYTQEARSLTIRDEVEEGPKKEPQRIPLGFQAREEGTPMDLISGAASIFHTRLVDADENNPLGIQFYRGVEPFEIPVAPLDPGGSGLPNLLLVVDSSGSMQFVRGNGRFAGKYHLVLLACWGIFRYIEEQQGTEGVQAASINFSSRSMASGWHPMDALEPVKRNLAVYQGNGTTLDVGVLRKTVEESPGRFLAVIVTDGGLGNTPDALRELGNVVRAGNRLVHLHIGPANAFTEGIKDLGCSVLLINNPEDLVGLCIDLAKQHYGEKARTPAGAGAS